MEKDLLRVKCYYTAIMEGVIPAHFASNKQSLFFDEIIYANRTGGQSKCIFEVRVVDASTGKNLNFTKKMVMTPANGPIGQLEGIYAEIYTFTYTALDNVRDSQPIKVYFGKNVGKSNATNCVTQAIRDAFSMYTKKKKMVANDKLFPMLVEVINKNPATTLTPAELSAGVIVERKFDGLRAIIHRKNGEVIVQSRTGQNYVMLTEIANEAGTIIPDETTYLDGEIYIHGMKLQSINSVLTGVANGERANLKFYIFDTFNTSNMKVGALERKMVLERMFEGKVFKRLIMVEYTIVNTLSEIWSMADRYISEGYEGAIVRRPKLPYEPSVNNYHSPNILKVKPRPDAEFAVVDYTEGAKGKDVGAIIFICETEKHNKFSCVPNMTYNERYHLFVRFQETDLFEKYVKGKMATIEYSIISESGIPLQPKFKSMRLADGDVDIIERLLRER